MNRAPRTRPDDARLAATFRAAPRASTLARPHGLAPRPLVALTRHPLISLTNRSFVTSISRSFVTSTSRSFVASISRSLVALLVIFCFATATARAATLDDYRGRVRQAITVVGQLGGMVDPDEWEEEDARVAAEVDRLAELRSLLPPRERVERANGAVEVDNGWLHKELDAYDAFDSDQVTDKSKKLTLVGDRLNSLAARLDEEAAAEQGARDKEAEKGRLQSILQRPEYNEEASKGGAFERFMQWLSDFFEGLFPKRGPVSPGTSSLFSVVARVLVYALAVALIAFLVWRYGPLLWNRAVVARREKAREARVVLGERLAPDQTSSDLIAEAERLARAGDLRGAIRKAYVAVLCELGDRHLIRLAQHKTNRDYLASLRERTELYGVMHPLTHTFERHWYGFAPASDADWADYRSLCNRAIE